MNTGSTDSSPMDVFSVFDSIVVTDSTFGLAQHDGSGGGLGARLQAVGPSGAGSVNVISSFVQNAHASAFEPALNLGVGGVVNGPAAGAGSTQFSVNLVAKRSGGSAAEPSVRYSVANTSEPWVAVPDIDLYGEATRLPAKHSRGLPLVPDSVLDELAGELVLSRGSVADHATLPMAGASDTVLASHSRRERGRTPQPARSAAAPLAGMLLVAGLAGHGAAMLAGGNSPAGWLRPGRKARFWKGLLPKRRR